MSTTTNVVSSNPAQAKCTTLCDEACQRLVAVRWFPPPIKLIESQYNRNIAESDVKHHNIHSLPIMQMCVQWGAYHCSDGPLFRRPIISTTHYSDSPLLRRPIFPTMQNRTQSINPWFNQVYPTGWSVGQANLDGPWPRQNVLERKRSFYPRLYIPAQGNYDRPTWYRES